MNVYMKEQIDEYLYVHHPCPLTLSVLSNDPYVKHKNAPMRVGHQLNIRFINT